MSCYSPGPTFWHLLLNHIIPACVSCSFQERNSAAENFSAAFSFTPKKKKKKQSGLVTSANNNINFCQRLHGNTDKLHFAISPTDKLGKSISTTACPHSTVNSAAYQRSRTPPPPLLLDFWHQTWISISLRSPKTICPVSLLLTGRCSQKQKRVDPSLPSLPSLGI